MEPPQSKEVITAMPALRCARGAALLDVLVTCGLITVLAAIAIPSLHTSRDRDAAIMAARFLASKLNLLRIEALRRNRAVALRFDPDDLGSVASYIDGDGDGVSQQDVDNGVDGSLDSARLADHFARVGFRIPAEVPAPDGVGVLAADSDPLRIGSSNFVSFSPLGTATSGTIYLAGRGTQVSVRVFGATGRIRVLRFDPASGAWRRD